MTELPAANQVCKRCAPDSSAPADSGLRGMRPARIQRVGPCRPRCKKSPRCAHPWWLDVMYKRVRYRMPVDEFAFARGATIAVASKQEAEKTWEPKFIAEIASGNDPRVAPGREPSPEQAATVADLLKLYRARYVEVEPLKSRAGVLSQVRVLAAYLGELPAPALERPDAIEDFKARYANRSIATTNRYLARLRHLCNWAIGRDLLTETAFHRRGVRIATKNERRRERRVSEAEEQRLLDACTLLNEPSRGAAKLTWDDVREIRARARTGVQQSELAATFNISRPLCNEIVRGHIWDPDAKLTTGGEMRDRIIGALDTGCRRGEMMKIQNKHVDWPPLDSHPEGAFQDGARSRHPLRIRQPAREAPATSVVSRT